MFCLKEQAILRLYNTILHKIQHFIEEISAPKPNKNDML